jgi:pyruvate,orthophosphate dikinase
MLMTRHALPVPPGFALGTDLCRNYLAKGETALEGLDAVLSQELGRLGEITGRRFGDAKRPLLVSVRSGAAVSMPGMMETVLNVGLCETAVQGLVRLTGNPRLAFDCRRRLIQQYAEVVHGTPGKPFEELGAERLERDRIASPHELDTEALAEVAQASLEQFETLTGTPFPEDPEHQLRATVEAVLKSWSSPRAQTYRRLNGIDDNAGTAVLVQAMVFGNAGPTSGSGVGFTRNPANGSKMIYIDYLPNAQGEDVVAGRRNALGTDEMERRAPEVMSELLARAGVLERAFGDAQDFEFTVEDGRLYMLQTRSAKRTPLAALRIARDLVAEKMISPKEALARVEALDLDAIEISEIDIAGAPAPLARAVPASVGVVAGIAAFDPTRLRQLADRGRPLILLREFAETVDIEAVNASAALVTARGARTSHAAVVARQLGKICLVGCDTLEVDPSGRSCRFGSVVVEEGEPLTVDGVSGTIYRGALPIRHRKPDDLLAELKRWRGRR